MWPHSRFTYNTLWWSWLSLKHPSRWRHLWSSRTPIWCSFSQTSCPYTTTVVSRNLRSIDINAFATDVTECRFTEVCSTTAKDPASGVEMYNKTLLGILNKHAPATTRTFKVRPNTNWYNNEVSEALRKRRQLERRWRSSRLEIDRQLYCKQRQHTISVIRKAKCQ